MKENKLKNLTKKERAFALKEGYIWGGGTFGQNEVFRSLDKENEFVKTKQDLKRVIRRQRKLQREINRLRKIK